jgi:signal peptidase I
MRTLGMAFVLFLLLHTFVLEAFQIPSGSMERTLLIGDFLFVNKAVYGAVIPGTHTRLPGFASPQRGDVVVFPYPRHPDTTFVKRIVGVAGDTLQMIEGRMLVNGVRRPEPYVERVDSLRNECDPGFDWQVAYLVDTSTSARARYHPCRDDWGPLVVPAHKYFVMGDNRDISLDSRYWGFVDASDIRGRPLIVYWSVNRDAHDHFPWFNDIRWSRLGSLIH